jgi:hypothetical protein
MPLLPCSSANRNTCAVLLSCRPLEEMQRVADGKLMYSNYRMEVIDPLLGLSALDSVMQVREIDAVYHLIQ